MNIKIKKKFIEEIMYCFQIENSCVFRDQKRVKMLIEYAIAKFIVESNKVK